MSFLTCERESFQDGLSLLIGKSHIFKFDHTTARSHGDCVGAIMYRQLGSHKLQHTLRIDHGRLDACIECAEVIQRCFE